MPEITEEEYQAIKKFYNEYLEGTCCSEINRKLIWKGLVYRIEAERKPKGYLDSEIYNWVGIDVDLGKLRDFSVTIGMAMDIFKKIKVDIARIFDEEIEALPKRDNRIIFPVILKSLKHRICGGEEQK